MMKQQIARDGLKRENKRREERCAATDKQYNTLTVVMQQFNSNQQLVYKKLSSRARAYAIKGRLQTVQERTDF
jgi:hypothetical protein